MMRQRNVRINEARKGKFTQKDMAAKLNISERQYRRIEKDECTPDIWTAFKIADALGVENLRELWNIAK